MKKLAIESRERGEKTVENVPFMDSLEGYYTLVGLLYGIFFFTFFRPFHPTCGLYFFLSIVYSTHNDKHQMYR